VGRRDSLVEFLNLLRDHPAGVTVVHASVALGVSRQHIYRLRDRARRVYGIWVDDRATDPAVLRGHLRLDGQHRPDVSVVLTATELDALLTAAHRIRNLTPLARRALEKIARGTPAERDLARDPVIYSPLADEYPPGLYERVADAIRERRTALVTYRNAKGEEKTYRFDPYILIARDPHLYLVGANHNSRAAGHDPVHELRLDQIVSFRLLAEFFPNPKFDVQAYSRQRFRWFPGEGEAVRVRVRFSPAKAEFIRRMKHHATQTIVDLPDGGLVWQVEVPLCEDMMHWIVGYGPHATVIEPEELRLKVAEWARGALEANMSPEGATTGAYPGLRR